MKQRSKIAAIFLSLSIMGSAQASSWSTIFAGITLVNAGPYIGALINSATNMANLYLNVQNNRKINQVSQQVAAVDQNVSVVNGNVIKVQQGLQRTNVLMGALHTDMKIGLNALNTKVDQHGQQIGVVHRDLGALREQQAEDTVAILARHDQTDAQLNLMQDGISGVHTRVGALEKITKKNFQELKTQGAYTQTQLTQMNDRLEDFSAFATTGMQQLAAIQTMLQMLTQKDSTKTNNNNNNQ